VPGTYQATNVDIKRPGVITLIAVLDLVFGSIYLLAVAGIAFSLESKEWDTTSVVILSILGVCGAVTILAGTGLMLMRSFGRLTQLVLSSIGLLAFPLGTIISVLILYYLTRPGVKVLFSGKRADQLTPVEAASVAQLQSSGGAGVVLAVAVGLLVVIGFMGILAAIAIPNLLTAMQRSKQKRTMADMRSMATAIEAYATDNNSYAPRNWTAPSDGDIVYDEREVRLGPGVRLDLDTLSKSLTPTYMKTLPRVDGWNHEIEVYVGKSGQEYAIRSLAKNGVAESDAYQVGGQSQFDCDIVYAMGQFVAYPEGVQTSTRH
jgi:general secretion pathway protein G